MNQVIDQLPVGTIVRDGGARGADTLAHKAAMARELVTETFYANWEKFGKSAGVRRNQEMIDDGTVDQVIAFPGGRGTVDMVQRAQAADIPVWYPTIFSPNLPL
jgi:hypothetical protein